MSWYLLPSGQPWYVDDGSPLAERLLDDPDTTVLNVEDVPAAIAAWNAGTAGPPGHPTDWATNAAFVAALATIAAQTAAATTAKTDAQAAAASVNRETAGGVAGLDGSGKLFESRIPDRLSDASLDAATAAVTDPLGDRVSDLEAAPAQATPDRGEGFVSKLDGKAPAAVIAVLSDSTAYKNGFGNYVGTDGFEWPRRLAKWIADTYGTAAVGYRTLTSASPITYAARLAVATGESTATVLSDTFPGSAGALAGTVPATGSAWTGAGYNLNGTGDAIQAANTATTGGTTVPGRLASVLVYELVPTASGNVNILGGFISSSTILWMTDNSSDTVDCKVSVAGTTLIVHTFTYADAGWSSSVTADVTTSITDNRDGTVTFRAGAASYTHTFTGGDNAAFASVGRAGMSGTRAGHKIRSISVTTTTSADTAVEVYNGSFSSKDAQWSQAGYADLVPVAPDVVIIAHSHNHEAETPAAFEGVLDSLVATIHATHPNAAIVIASQNPETSVATNYVAHNARVADMRNYARSRGFGYLPFYEAFRAQANLPALLNSDGLHPLPPGVDLLGTAATSYFATLSLRP